MGFDRHWHIFHRIHLKGAALSRQFSRDDVMSSLPIDQSFVDDLLTLPLDELMLRARNVRDAAHGTRVT
jgi:hypothetical protein